ncbi:MAG: hypothetical protein MPL62_07570 [Alphaproteobacteria bacterium]|nr:hypothetical protein [Alphaproteobacteria bacterium]
MPAGAARKKLKFNDFFNVSRETLDKQGCRPRMFRAKHPGVADKKRTKTPRAAGRACPV